MILKNISLLNFRNYNTLNLDFGNNINILYGDNGQGKTNLLESIYVLGITKSHRSYIDENLILTDENLSVIKGKIEKEDSFHEYKLKLSKTRKELYINDTLIKKNSEYLSNINVIIFYPEDLDIIKGSPFMRRRYLDIELSQLHKNYYLLLNDYNKIIKMKNNLLKKNQIDINYYQILNNYLVEKSINIYFMRNKYVSKINDIANKIFFDLTGIENFNIKYKSNIKNLETLSSIKKEISDLIKLKEKKEFEIKKSIVGPHLDDIEFYIGNNNLRFFGSQGQQRMAILSFKLSEIEIFKQYKCENPILLLDDVFSELDNKKKNKLLKYINGNVQTIITTTDLKNINKKILTDSKIFKVKNGNIEEVE